MSWYKSLDLNQCDNLYVNDKRVFVFINFIDSHPDTKITTYNQLEYILAEKHSFAKWYQGVKKQWELLNDVPEWLLSDSTLREVWLAEYQDKLVELKKKRATNIKALKNAKVAYDLAIYKANEDLAIAQEEIYLETPVLLINDITEGSLPEYYFLAKHSLDTKEERSRFRQEELAKFKLNLLNKFTKGELTVNELLTLVKDGVL